MKRAQCLSRTSLALWVLISAMSIEARGQFAAVMAKLDTNQIVVGSTTTLRVLAQITPAQRATTDRIFSWYVDLVNSNANVARADLATLQKIMSDRDPRTSSSGTRDGGDLRGIYDTFIGTAGAGREVPIELFSVQVTGLTPGRMSFTVAPGSGISGLTADFIVARAGGGEPLIGGLYDLAKAEIEVLQSTDCRPRLDLTHAPSPAGGNLITITFAVCPGRSSIVEYRDGVGSGEWQALPGAPHTSGLASDTTNVAQRFYRLRIAP